MFGASLRFVWRTGPTGCLSQHCYECCFRDISAPKFSWSLKLIGSFAFVSIRFANISMRKQSFLRAYARDAVSAVLAWRSGPSPFALSSAYGGYARLPSHLFPRRQSISKSMLPSGVSGWLLENRAETEGNGKPWLYARGSRMVLTASTK